MARSYRELLVWQKAKALAVHVFRATEVFPRSQLYGLTSQLRRAAVSVASNIAEGQGRLTTGEFLHFWGRREALSLNSIPNLQLPAISNTSTRRATKT